MRFQTLIILVICTLIEGCSGSGNSGSNSQENLATATPTCDEGTAMIGVHDGYLQVLCGCGEGVGTVAQAGTKFTCTLAEDVEVIFQYVDTQVAHQIISDGEPAFPGSAISDPADEDSKITAHGVFLDQSGTYAFKDAYNHTLYGEIIIP